MKDFLHKYFIVGLNGMAYGLFSSLIINLIISQLSKIPGLDVLRQLSDVFGASSPVVGAAIGVAIAYVFKAKGFVLYSSVAAGACGYAFGGPVGAYIAAVVGIEVGSLVAGKTKVDIIVTPLVTIISGGLVALFVGPYIQQFMLFLGGIINDATEMNPFFMGIIISVIVGLALTAPISSAALCIMMDLSGIAAGAAAVGCSCQMVGFAVASYKDNGIGGVISVGLGTSMLQFTNALRHPQLFIAPILASAILGPISTVVLKMTNNAIGAGMGTSGLVGQISAYATMVGDVGPVLALIEIITMHVILPAMLVWSINKMFYRAGWIKKGYLKLKTK